VRIFCDIPEKQNAEPHLGRLAACSTFYQWAKLVLAVQFAVTVPAAFVFSLTIFAQPKAKLWTTFGSLTAALLDALVLERIQGHYRKLAAKTQELFDCDLLRMEWRLLRAGEKPDTEDIVHAAAHYRKRCPSMERLIDWYPKAVASVPLSLARLVCQRTNCWWDSSLRKKYANVLIGLLIVTLVAVFSLSLAQGHTLEQMILAVYVPVAPAVLWTIRESSKQYDAAESLDILRGHIDSVWCDALKGRLQNRELEDEARQIQDIIFDGRSKNPMVFNWINNLVRPRHQVSMNAKAVEMVQEALGSGVCEQL
jgi:hypothetical protein